MSSEEANCHVQHQQKIFKTQAEPEDDSSLFSKLKLKYENEQDDSSYHQSSELNNFENTSSYLPIKQEPTDTEDEFHQVQPENVKLKDVEIKDHKPVWELMEVTSKPELFDSVPDESDFVAKTEPICSPATRTEEHAKYNCAHCPFKVNKRRYFMQHYNYKHKRCTKVYKCNKCSYKTRIENYFVRHCKRKHSRLSQVYKCDECSFQARYYKSDLIRHYISKHAKEAEVYKCPECPYETKVKRYLTHHKKYKHSTEMYKYKCQKCSYEAKYKNQLTQHHKSKHSEDAEVYKCKGCSFETKIKHSLIRHCIRKHSKEVEVYKCQDCMYKTTVKNYLTRHYMYKHSKEVEVYKK